MLSHKNAKNKMQIAIKKLIINSLPLILSHFLALIELLKPSPAKNIIDKTFIRVVGSNSKIKTTRPKIE